VVLAHSTRGLDARSQLGTESNSTSHHFDRRRRRHAIDATHNSAAAAECWVHGERRKEWVKPSNWGQLGEVGERAAQVKDVSAEKDNRQRARASSVGGQGSGRGFVGFEYRFAALRAWRLGFFSFKIKTSSERGRNFFPVSATPVCGKDREKGA
jgi:hypothetical protein